MQVVSIFASDLPKFYARPAYTCIRRPKFVIDLPKLVTVFSPMQCFADSPKFYTANISCYTVLCCITLRRTTSQSCVCSACVCMLVCVCVCACVHVHVCACVFHKSVCNVKIISREILYHVLNSYVVVLLQRTVLMLASLLPSYSCRWANRKKWYASAPLQALSIT